MLYILTRGKTDIETMNKAERMEIYMAMLGMILNGILYLHLLILLLNSLTLLIVHILWMFSDFMGTQIDRAAYVGILSA